MQQRYFCFVIWFDYIFSNKVSIVTLDSKLKFRFELQHIGSLGLIPMRLRSLLSICFRLWYVFLFLSHKTNLTQTQESTKTRDGRTYGQTDHYEKCWYRVYDDLQICVKFLFCSRTETDWLTDWTGDCCCWWWWWFCVELNQCGVSVSNVAFLNSRLECWKQVLFNRKMLFICQYRKLMFTYNWYF